MSNVSGKAVNNNSNQQSRQALSFKDIYHRRQPLLPSVRLAYYHRVNNFFMMSMTCRTES
jgi:hypothetical protein